MSEQSRTKSTAARLLGATNKSAKENAKQPVKPTEPVFEPNRKNISKLIKDQGSGIRVADSIRTNPIITASLKYWTSIIDPSKSKPDIVEEALLKHIPEEILIEGYNLAKKQNKIWLKPLEYHDIIILWCFFLLLLSYQW